MKIIIKESKIKEVIKKKLGIDLTDRIKRIERYYDLPMYFQMAIPRYMFIEYLNQFGPMYLFNGNTDSYLYQIIGNDLRELDKAGRETYFALLPGWTGTHKELRDAAASLSK